MSRPEDLVAAFAILDRLREEKDAWMHLEEIEPGTHHNGCGRWLLWFDLPDGDTSLAFTADSLLDVVEQAQRRLSPK